MPRPAHSVRPQVLLAARPAEARPEMLGRVLYSHREVVPEEVAEVEAGRAVDPVVDRAVDRAVDSGVPAGREVVAADKAGHKVADRVAVVVVDRVAGAKLLVVQAVATAAVVTIAVIVRKPAAHAVRVAGVPAVAVAGPGRVAWVPVAWDRAEWDRAEWGLAVVDREAVEVALEATLVAVGAGPGVVGDLRAESARRSVREPP